jgi:hypothetical protein
VKECERANAANNQREQQDVYELGFHLQETLGIAERFGSGDGERKTMLTRQMPYEPPACIRFVRPCSRCVLFSHLSETMMPETR